MTKNKCLNEEGKMKVRVTEYMCDNCSRVQRKKENPFDKPMNWHSLTIYHAEKMFEIAFCCRECLVNWAKYEMIE